MPSIATRIAAVNALADSSSHARMGHDNVARWLPFSSALLAGVALMACDLTEAPHTLIREIEAPQRQTVVKRLATERIRDLGWRPEVSLAEGMEQTLEWVRTLGDDGLPREDWWQERVSV